MSKFEIFMERYNEAETEQEEEEALLEALKIAEKNNDMEKIVKCHLKLVYYNLFSGNNVNAMNQLLWVISNVTEDMINNDWEIYYDLILKSKYITGLVRTLNYEKDMIKELFEWAENLYTNGKENLKPLHGVLIYYYCNGLDLGYDIEDIFNKWKETSNEYFDDCASCLKDTEINYFLRLKDYKKAFTLAEDFEKENISCEETPSLTYSKLLYPLTDENQLKLADKYCKKAYNLCKNDLNLISGIIRVIAYLATRNTEKAFEIYLRHLNFFDKIDQDYDLLELYFTSYILFSKLSKTTDQVVVPFTRNDEVHYTNELIIHFRNKYQETAESFDKRNGNSYLTKFFKEKEECYLNGSKNDFRKKLFKSIKK
ncbi:MAG: hypothetical protein LBU74_05100 [Methanobacteriaceae archaeon]|jgi:hypothetical protein|nr:hypothetical protein [Candidatus Methanorudis spinitermitis]